jgi:hypothetical protein
MLSHISSCCVLLIYNDRAIGTLMCGTPLSADVVDMLTWKIGTTCQILSRFSGISEASDWLERLR